MQGLWQTLTKREKALVSGAAVLLLMTLVYLLGIRPLALYHAESERAFKGALKQFRVVQSYAVQLQAGTANGSDKPANQQSISLRLAVSNAARAAGVEISRLQPSEDGTLTIWAERIQSQQLFEWLETLSATQGIGPQNVLIQKTSAPGTLRVQLQFTDDRQ